MLLQVSRPGMGVAFLNGLLVESTHVTIWILALRKCFETTIATELLAAARVQLMRKNHHLKVEQTDAR